MSKSPEAFRTISEVSEWLDTPTYVLRFWESRFSQIKPVKRAGGRRYYRPEDMMLLGGIKKLLHFDELTIKAVKQILKDKGVKHVMDLSPDLSTPVVSPQSKADEAEKAEIAKMVEAGPVAEPVEVAEEKPAPEKPAVEVRVIKKGKIAPDAEEKDVDGAQANEAPDEPQDAVSEDTAPAPVVAESSETDSAEDEKPQAADSSEDAKEEAKQAVEAATTVPVAEEPDAAASEEHSTDDAADWENLTAAMIGRGPIKVKTATDYAPDVLEEIETLYYSLRIARNGMARAKAEQEKSAG